MHLFLYLFVLFCQIIFDQHIGTVAFFAVLVIDERVVESIHMSRCFPYGGVHEDGGI